MKRKEIKQWLETKYDFKTLVNDVDENILDYVDSDWEEDGYDDEYEWYRECGRGEAEDVVINQIVSDFMEEMDEPNDEWYFKDKYGDFNEIIFEVYPFLDV